MLSVIIPTLNEAEHLPDLLADLGQQEGIPFEIIVGDGGSSDATREIAEAGGARFIRSSRGRGIQMNAAAAQAAGDYLLFLHADSRLEDPHLLSTAIHDLSQASRDCTRVAGHFRLRFIRSTTRNTVAYRYAEAKTALNRANTTNGDQGLLLSREFFRQLGGFDERLPFLEDQLIAGKIHAEGRLVTLPGYLKTSARRFETEGFHRRYILMSMMMGLYSVGIEDFFVRAPGVYRTQQDTGTLLLTPFFELIWNMMRDEWRVRGTLSTFYRLGRYIRQNSWQPFFFIDVRLRPLFRGDRYPFLTFHDRVFGPCTDFALFNLVTGVTCFIWFMGILFPLFRCIERNVLLSREAV